MSLTSDSWLALVVSLPSASATARMRIWRAVKALGCAALRDGAYLLPAQAEQAAQLQTLADEATAVIPAADPRTASYTAAEGQKVMAYLTSQDVYG